MDAFSANLNSESANYNRSNAREIPFIEEKIRLMRDKFIERAIETATSTIKQVMNSATKVDEVHRVREKYRGLPLDRLADILIKIAARKTAIEGAANGLGITGCEVVASAPVPEVSHKAIASAGVATLLLTDIGYTTHAQMQLLSELAALYGCPFEADDDEDVWTVFMAALGLKGTEKIGGYSRFIFTEAARKQFRKLLRAGIRKAVQDRIIKIAGPKVGIYLGEKYIMRLVPVANAVIGYHFNKTITNRVGQWGKLKIKIRSSTFKCVKIIEEQQPEALLWALPIIFYVGTADEKLTDSVMTLYSQTGKRVPLTEEQRQRVEVMINDENLPRIFSEELPHFTNETVRRTLYDLATTTAAVNLAPRKEHEFCLRKFAADLRMNYSESDLQEKVRYLKR